MIIQKPFSMKSKNRLNQKTRFGVGSERPAQKIGCLLCPSHLCAEASQQFSPSITWVWYSIDRSTDKMLCNSGSATAAPAVPGAALLNLQYVFVKR